MRRRFHLNEFSMFNRTLLTSLYFLAGTLSEIARHSLIVVESREIVGCQKLTAKLDGKLHSSNLPGRVGLWDVETRLRVE